MGREAFKREHRRGVAGRVVERGTRFDNDLRRPAPLRSLSRFEAWVRTLDDSLSRSVPHAGSVRTQVRSVFHTRARAPPETRSAYSIASTGPRDLARTSWVLSSRMNLPNTPFHRGMTIDTAPNAWAMQASRISGFDSPSLSR